MIAVQLPGGPNASTLHTVLWTLVVLYAPGLFVLLGMATGVQNLLDGARRARTENRRHLLWLLGGVAASALMIVVPISVIPVVGDFDCRILYSQ